MVAARRVPEPAVAVAADVVPSPKLRALMSKHVGVIRNGPGLSQALATIADMEFQASTPALQNIATAALMITAAAFARRESRGAHFRLDFPASEPSQAQRSMLTLSQARKIADEAYANRRITADAY